MTDPDTDGDKLVPDMFRNEAHLMAVLRDALVAEGFSREEAVDIIVAYGKAASDLVGNQQYGPTPLVKPHIPHPSHRMGSVPDRMSRSCSGCGQSEFDTAVAEPCRSPAPPPAEAPGTDEAPGPPEPDTEQQLVEEQADHANETGHGVDDGS